MSQYLRLRVIKRVLTYMRSLCDKVNGTEAGTSQRVEFSNPVYKKTQKTQNRTQNVEEKQGEEGMTTVPVTDTSPTAKPAASAHTANPSIPIWKNKLVWKNVLRVCLLILFIASLLVVSFLLHFAKLSINVSRNAFAFAFVLDCDRDSYKPLTFRYSLHRSISL